MKTPDQIDKLWFLDTLVRIHVARDGGADGMSVMEHVVPYGSSPPLHIHHTEDEIFHMLAGEIRLLVDGTEIRARAGDTLLAPKGKPHSFVVTAPAGARWLTMTNGGDFERMVRAAGRPAERDALPPHAGRPSREQIDALAAVCRENRIELVGPPLN